MKITVYEIREDEKKIFRQLAGQHQLEINYVDGPLNQQTLQQAAGSQAITVLGAPLHASLLHQLKELDVSFIATRTVGYNHIDLQAAKACGIRISNVSYGPEGVADYTIMLMLMSLRKYKQAMFRANVNDYSLTGLQGKEMKDLTIGILGTGKIGQSVISRLSGFGCKIIAYDTITSPSMHTHIDYVPLDELYKKSDVISLHVPLFESTQQMINSRSIKKMKDGVVLVNCSRGELMNIPDLIDAIEQEKIGALALDVFENEAGIYHVDRRTEIIKNRDMAYLRQFPNVIMTQHMAFYTDAAVQSMVSCGIENIMSFISRGTAEHEIIIH